MKRPVTTSATYHSSFDDLQKHQLLCRHLFRPYPIGRATVAHCTKCDAIVSNVEAHAYEIGYELGHQAGKLSAIYRPIDAKIRKAMKNAEP
jgi:hypothetical protein